MRRGDLIGERFEIDEHVASGGMGQVFRARDVHSGAVVAVKVLLGGSAALEARFDREARMLSTLAHPGIVHYLAHGDTAAGERYLAMEWLEGEDLARRLSRGPLAIDDCVALAMRVAEAMHAPHARGIIHRDLKPSNIFLEDGRLDRAKVLDFGVARQASGTRVTGTGLLLGTPGYMAPEQAGAGGPIDARADVFSLGCVLFECLTGAPAFQADHPVALLAKVLFADPPRLGDLVPEAPAELDALLGRMLAKDPAERPAHAGLVAAALAAIGKQAAGGAVARPAAALTRGEQRMFSIVLVGGDGEVLDGGILDGGIPTRSDVPTRPNLSTRSGIASVHMEDTLRRGAAVWGGRFAELRGGAVAVALGGGLITDQAAAAARCALWLRTRLAGRPMALATGRGDSTGRLPAAEIIDRAAAMVPPHAGAPDADAARAGIAIDEVTARLLDARFDVREHGGAYRLHGERELALETRMLLGRPTPCVGRDLELRTLVQLFEECTEEPAPRVALVTAPPGTGKSRLAQELLRGVMARGAPAVWSCRGEPSRAGSAFGLLSQLLHGACGLQGGEPLDVQRDRLAARVGAHVDPGERRRIAEFLGELTGAPFPDDDSLPLRAARQDPQLMHEQMLAAFLDFLAAETAARPLILLLEDVHWGDRPTVRFIDEALRELRGRPLFVLALARPEVHEQFPRLWAERAIQELRLKQLGRKASERLALHVLGEGSDRQLVDRLVRLSDGNAFYLEELIRAAAEGRRGDLPETVVAMVQSRLDDLDDDARRILRAAAVFGEVFWPGALARLLGATALADGLAQSLEALVERELVTRRKESRFPGESELAFRHTLVREGAYATLTDEDRALGHRLAGEWLEERGDHDPLALAEHFERGGERARAGQHYLRAAEQAARGGDFPASIDRARRALAAGVAGELRTRCVGMLCELHYFRMELADALPYAEEALRVAPRGSGPWSHATTVKLVSSLQAGRVEEFAELLAAAGETAPAPGDAFPWTLCIATGVFLLDLLGRARAADGLLRVIAEGARAAGEQEPLASVIYHSILTVRTAYAEEDPLQGLRHGETYLRLSEAAGQRRYMELARFCLGMNRWFLGDLAGAEPLLRGVTVSENDGGLLSSYRPFVLAWLCADRGDLREAQLWADSLVEAGRARQLPIDEGRGHWVRAEVLRRAGALADADAAIASALALLRAVSAIDVPGALATLAALRLAQHRPADALAAAEEGLARHEAAGACGFFRASFLRLIHAESLDASLSRDAAAIAIAAARTRLLAIAATIDDPDHRHHFLENVPENRRTLALASLWPPP